MTETHRTLHDVAAVQFDEPVLELLTTCESLDSSIEVPTPETLTNLADNAFDPMRIEHEELGMDIFVNGEDTSRFIEQELATEFPEDGNDARDWINDFHVPDMEPRLGDAELEFDDSDSGTSSSMDATSAEPDAQVVPSDILNPNAVTAGAERARRGQLQWMRELGPVKAEWKAQRVGQQHPVFAAQLSRALKTFRFQKICLLLKLQLAVVQSVVQATFDQDSGNFTAFCVARGRQQEFRRRFDLGLEFRSFCSLFRRAGFIPEGRAWEAAFRGEAWLKQRPGTAFP